MEISGAMAVNLNNVACSKYIASMKHQISLEINGAMAVNQVVELYCPLEMYRKYRALD